MAYAFERTNKSGSTFTGIYVDPDGGKRSAGTFRSKREAVRAAHREEQKVAEGR